MRCVLKPLKSKRTTRYCTLDIEAYEWINCYMVGFFDGKDFHSFDTIEEFLDFYLSKNYASWKCFAHNGRGYDFKFILEELTFNPKYKDYKLKIVDGQGIAELIVYSPNTNRIWYFMDSLRLLSGSLKDLTMDFDVVHKKIDLDVSDVRTIPKDKLCKYLEYDVRGLYEVLEKFEQFYLTSGIGIERTMSTQSMTIFRSMMKNEIIGLTPKEEDFSRKAFYGGRSEVFKLHASQKIYGMDVNSLYPYVMKKYPMPIGKPIRTSKFSKENLGIYEVIAEIPDIYIPPLPYIRDGSYSRKIIYPTGKLRGVYTSMDLQNLVLHGGSFKVIKGYKFSHDFIFSDFIGKYSKMKENAKNKAEKICSKNIQNFLFGKFGQNRIKDTIIRSNNPEIFMGLSPYDFENGLFIQTKRSRANFIIPSIPAFVTAYARFELQQLFNRAGYENVYYSDTDSVFSTKKLPLGNKLGELKLEYSGDEAIFLRPKMYAIRDGNTTIIKIKGYPKKIKEDFDFESFKKGLFGDFKSFEKSLNVVAGYKESFRRNGTFLSIIERKKSIKSEYDKRIVLPSFDTKPIELR